MKPTYLPLSLKVKEIKNRKILNLLKKTKEYLMYKAKITYCTWPSKGS